MILDWIAQAQLFVSVGPEKYLKLREIGVRDIHGVLALGDDGKTRKALKPIVFGDFQSPDEGRLFPRARRTSPRPAPDPVGEHARLAHGLLA